MAAHAWSISEKWPLGEVMTNVMMNNNCQEYDFKMESSTMQ